MNTDANFWALTARAPAKGPFAYPYLYRGSTARAAAKRMGRARTEFELGHMHVVTPDPFTVFTTQVAVLRDIWDLRDVDVIGSLENAQAKNEMDNRGRVTFAPLTVEFYFAFHVMGWPASKS